MQLQPLIINAAITGMVPTKTDTPHVPISIAEIIADAKRCYDAGATIIHVHARDEAGQPTYSPEIYEAMIQGIRAACPDLLISGSTSGRLHREFWQRSAVLQSQPDLASLTLGSLNFPKQVSINAPDMIKSLATAMSDRGIIPEMELFDLGMADYAKYLIDQQIIRPPFYANILLGSLGTLAATPYNLAAIVRALPEGTTWAATGIGRFQLYVNSLAVTMGGHVRVGIEDNIWYDLDRTELATNARLIERIVQLARCIERDVATPAQTRQLMGLPPKINPIVCR
jgi:3-keto-5-aminohexanoate cleavage enzyme